MKDFQIDWEQKHILLTSTKRYQNSETIISENPYKEHDPNTLKGDIEPWLSAIFQSEHLSLLVGSGLTSGITFQAKVKSQDMGRLNLSHQLKDIVLEKANQSAKELGRGEANIEDDIRIAIELIRGLYILGDSKAKELQDDLNNQLRNFVTNILSAESQFIEKLQKGEPEAIIAFNLLKSFLLSFTSRAASRERLNIFTTNYDRFIELACDETGVLLLDRFKGKLRPVFRNTRLELDYHYNPPGIRGEPRYVEGVARITKLHGSIDWQFRDKYIIKSLLPFGAEEKHPSIPESIFDYVAIYPNSSKDIETAFYPYAELFRDFSSAICQPNSVIVVYGYGFGDSHINRVIEDMLTIPSTHLVIIAWDMKQANGSFGAARDRISKFLENKNTAQLTLLIGEHFGNINNLVNYYLPKSAIDRLTLKMQKLKSNREGSGDTDNDGAAKIKS